jgi:hypothetical protein
MPSIGKERTSNSSMLIRVAWLTATPSGIGAAESTTTNSTS